MYLEGNFTATGFLEKLSRGELSAIRCKTCSSYVMPPTSLCSKCLSSDLEWVKISQRGKVISFSEIHVSNKDFQHMLPYIVGIIETEEGIRLPGVFESKNRNQIHVGDPITITLSQGSKRYASYSFALRKETSSD